MTSAPAIPKSGGMLDFNCNGVAGCGRCGWRGVPTVVDGVESTFCPRCERGPGGPGQVLLPPTPRVALRQPPRAGKPSRNAPCPCGSGVKHKKCCGA